MIIIKYLNQWQTEADMPLHVNETSRFDMAIMPKSYRHRIVSNTLRGYLRFIFSKLLALSRTAEMEIYRPNHRIESERPKCGETTMEHITIKTTTYSCLNRNNKEKIRAK